MDKPSPILRVCTYNIHKGVSRRRVAVHELKERLQMLDADLVFLQEVQGMNLKRSRKHADWPAEPQHEFLAAEAGWQAAYGSNSVYDHGHHGNALLSRHTIIEAENHDVSANSFERRGLLHCKVNVPPFDEPLHCVCVHFGLTARWRRRQIQALVERVEEHVPEHAPLIIAGDFNDWRNHADDLLRKRLDLTEACSDRRGRPPRSFPSMLPVFRLDRIYTRGFSVRQCNVHFGPTWSRISDHAVLTAELGVG